MSRFCRILQTFFSAAALLLLAVLLFLFRADAAEGVRRGIAVCLQTLLPALFPFILLSALFSGARSTAILCRPFGWLMRRGFRLPACAVPALLLGLCAGYPAGAAAAAALYSENRLSKNQTARLLCCCTAPGAAFCLFAGGEQGWLLFCASVLSPLCIGLISGRFAPKPLPAEDPSAPRHDFTDAVRRSVSSALTLCSFVVIFSALLQILDAAGWLSAAVCILPLPGFSAEDRRALLLYALEVTAGAGYCAAHRLPPVLTAFGLGFAGLCIHLQIFSFFRKPSFPMHRAAYGAMRFVTGLLTAIFYLMLAYLFPHCTAVAAMGQPLAAVSSGSTAASVSLLLLSVFFLLSCRRENKET